LGAEVANEDEKKGLTLQEIRHEYTYVIAYLHASSRRFTPIVLGLLQWCIGFILSVGFVVVYKLTEDVKASYVERHFLHGSILGIVLFSAYLIWFLYHMKQIADDHRILLELVANRDNTTDDHQHAMPYMKLQHMVQAQGFVNCVYVHFTPEAVMAKARILYTIIIIAVAFVGTGSGGHH